MLPYRLLDAESTSCDWVKRCISCSIQIDTSVTNHAQIFEGVHKGELRPIIKESGQIVGVRVEAYHLRLLCIDSERLSSCVRSWFVQHGLHVISVIGHEGKVICKQHMSHQKIWTTGERTFYPVCSAINVVQVDGEQQRGEGTSSFNTRRLLHRSCLIPIQQCRFISMIQVSKDGQDVVRYLATA